MGRTTTVYAKMPITIDGTPLSRSVRYCTTNANPFRPYSARYTPPRNPKRDADRGREREHLRAPDDRVGHSPAVLAHRLRQLREECPIQRARALQEQVAEDEEQQAADEQRAQPGQREHHVVHGTPHPAPLRAGHAGCALWRDVA